MRTSVSVFLPPNSFTRFDFMQASFPADKRMIDKDTGVDKGPFWGEKKR